MLLASSCIVADPPEYQNPVRTRPVLDEYGAAPPTNRVLVVNTNDLVKISVPLRSEDAGERLTGVFWVDLNAGSSGLLQNVQNIAPSTYSNDQRAVTLDWTVPSLTPTPGCHLLSLIVAHASSFQLNPSYALNTDAANGDVTVINWWLNVVTDASQASTLIGCPTAGIPSK